MIFGIITILLTLVPFIMFTQPLFWAYAGAGRDIANAVYKEISCYEGIRFDGENILYIIGVVCMIFALVMAVVTAILTILNMVAKSNGHKKVVGVKVCAFFFFLMMLASVVLVGVYYGLACNVKTFDDLLAGTVGYGLLGSFVASLFALIFAPKKK